MPLDLNQVASKRASGTIEFQGQTGEIVYNPGYLTAEHLLAAQNNGDKGMIDFLIESVVSWDFRKGTRKLPVNEKTIKQDLPIGLVREVYRFLAQGGASGDPTTESSSSDG